MRQRLWGFLVVFLLMFNGEIFGQEKNTWNLSHQSKTIQLFTWGKEIGIKQWTNRFSSDYAKNIAFDAGFLYKLQRARTAYSFIRAEKIPESYSFRLASRFYLESLGIFCKKELQLDKLTPVHFRFRLGSLDYVNWMEQKPNAIKQQ